MHCVFTIINFWIALRKSVPLFEYDTMKQIGYWVIAAVVAWWAHLVGPHRRGHSMWVWCVLAFPTVCKKSAPACQTPPRPLCQSETLRDRETRDKSKTKDCWGRDKTKTTKKWSQDQPWEQQVQCLCPNTWCTGWGKGGLLCWYGQNPIWSPWGRQMNPAWRFQCQSGTKPPSVERHAGGEKGLEKQTLTAYY